MCDSLAGLPLQAVVSPSPQPIVPDLRVAPALGLDSVGSAMMPMPTTPVAEMLRVALGGLGGIALLPPTGLYRPTERRRRSLASDFSKRRSNGTHRPCA